MRADWPAAVMASRKGFCGSALEEGPDDADRLAAVVERRVELGPPRAELGGQLLDLARGSGRTPRPRAVCLMRCRMKRVVEELLGLLGHHLRPGRRSAGSNASVSSTFALSRYCA